MIEVLIDLSNRENTVTTVFPTLWPVINPFSSTVNISSLLDTHITSLCDVLIGKTITSSFDVLSTSTSLSPVISIDVGNISPRTLIITSFLISGFAFA